MGHFVVLVDLMVGICVRVLVNCPLESVCVQRIDSLE